jgi:hypothetical protein
MQAQRQLLNHRPRELRRRVMLRARLREASGWNDICILNVSSRGLMINGPIPVKDDEVELWHGERLIIATVVWRKGTRAGLQAAGRVDVDEILALSNSPSLRLTAGSWPEVDRRRTPRASPDQRARGRALEYAGLVIIAATLAVAALGLVERAFAGPIGLVSAVLSG